VERRTRHPLPVDLCGPSREELGPRPLRAAARRARRAWPPWPLAGPIIPGSEDAAGRRASRPRTCGP
jgi:hypothetical protein